MIISISGKPGSGKSTVAKKLAEKLGYKRYYMGDLFRKAAKKKDLSLVEYLKMGEKDHSIDRKVDEYLEALGKNEDNFVVEGRTAYHFIPHSLKIFLEVSEKEGAERIFGDFEINEMRNEAKSVKNIEEVLALNKERMKSDKKRYRDIYGLEVFNPKNFDYVIDTTGLSIKEEFDRVWKVVDQKMK